MVALGQAVGQSQGMVVCVEVDVWMDHSWEWEMLKTWWVGLQTGEGWWGVVGGEVFQVFRMEGGVPTHYLVYLK